MFRRYAQHSNALERVLCVRISHSLPAQLTTPRPPSPVVVVSGVVVGIKSRRMKLLSTTNTANRGATADDDRSPQLCDTACATRTHRGDSTRYPSDAGPPPSDSRPESGKTEPSGQEAAVRGPANAGASEPGDR